jgi:hypothetical protein
LLTEFKNEIYRKKFKFGNKETLDKNGIVKEHKKFRKLNIQVICDTSSIQQSIFWGTRDIKNKKIENSDNPDLLNTNINKTKTKFEEYVPGFFKQEYNLNNIEYVSLNNDKEICIVLESPPHGSYYKCNPIKLIKFFNLNQENQVNI